MEFTFNYEDKYKPDEVIKGILNQIDEVTRGYVSGHIEVCEPKLCGDSLNIQIYSDKDLSKKIQSMFNEQADIQKKLGAEGIENYAFEVYLTVKNLKHYKYRMMFIEYSTISYPVKIIMEEELARDFSGQNKYIFRINSMEDLEELMNKVINSSYMVSLIQSLINEYSIRLPIKFHTSTCKKSNQFHQLLRNFL